jgi:hypothetical protein
LQSEADQTRSVAEVDEKTGTETREMIPEDNLERVKVIGHDPSMQPQEREILKHVLCPAQESVFLANELEASLVGPERGGEDEVAHLLRTKTGMLEAGTAHLGCERDRQLCP